MPAHDLYVDYLRGISRDELRLMAHSQGVYGFSRMDKPELIYRLISIRFDKASALVVECARSWHCGASTSARLSDAVNELESLLEALTVAREAWESVQEGSSTAKE